MNRYSDDNTGLFHSLCKPHSEGKTWKRHLATGGGEHLLYGSIINCSAIVEHGCWIEAGVLVCLEAIVKAENRIPRHMKIEAEVVVKNRAYPP